MANLATHLACPNRLDSGERRELGKASKKTRGEPYSRLSPLSDRLEQATTYLVLFPGKIFPSPERLSSHNSSEKKDAIKGNKTMTGNTKKGKEVKEEKKERNFKIE